MRRITALFIALCMLISVAAAEGMAGSIVFGDFEFIPSADLEVIAQGDEGWMLRSGDVFGTVSYNAYEELGIVREDIWYKDGENAVISMTRETVLAMYDGIMNEPDWESYLCDIYYEGALYGENCVGTLIHGNTVPAAGKNGYYCFVMLADENGVMSIFLKSDLPQKDEVLAFAWECVDMVTCGGEPLNVETVYRQKLGEVVEGREFVPTLNGRQVTLPEDWMAYTTEETYMECLAPVGVFKLMYLNYEADSDAVVAMNMPEARIYERHEEQVYGLYGEELAKDAVLERIYIEGYIPALRYTLRDGDAWYCGLVFFTECEHALIQLYNGYEPDAECFAALETAAGLYLQGADYIVYEGVEFLPTYDYQCVGNFEVLIKSGWQAVLFDGGFDFYVGNGLGSVSYLTIDEYIPEEAIRDENGNLYIDEASVEPLLKGIINSDNFRELFISADVVGYLGGSNCAGIMIAGKIDMQNGPMDYALVMLTDGEGIMNCHTFGYSREEAVGLAEQFVSAVTVYLEPPVLTLCDTPVAVFGQDSVPASQSVLATFNGREVELPSGWMQPEAGVDMYVYQDALMLMQVWLFGFEYSFPSDKDMYGGNKMGGQDLVFVSLKEIAAAAFGFEDLDAEGIEYEKSTVYDGRQCLKVKLPMDGYILYAYVFYAPQEIAVMYTPCLESDAEFSERYLDDIVSVFFR